MTLTKRWRFLILFSLFILFTLLVASLLSSPSLGIDDAYIFMTYGKNLANGHGLVYYPGGERVEGFSSILWMLVNALGFAITNQPQWGLLLINLIMVSFALTHLWIFIDESNRITWRGILLLVWVFSTPGYVFWVSLSLMDTALWSTCLMLAAISVLSPDKQKWLGWLIVFLVLARPEGLLWPIAFIGIRFLLEAMRTSITAGLTAIKKPALIYFVTVLLLTVGRLLYFGYPLPNTYYAKMSPDIVYNLTEGAIYLRDFIVVNPPVLLLSLALSFILLVVNLPWILRHLRHPSSLDNDIRRGQVVGACLIVLIALAVPVYNGGDHFTLFRFFQVAWPLLIIPFLLFVTTLSIPVVKRHKMVFVFAAMGFFVVTPLVSWLWNFPTLRAQIEFDIAVEGMATAEELNNMFAGTPQSAGIITAGGFGFAYQGPVIDVVGLNNVEMAHAPGDRYGKKNHAAFNPDVFLRQRPVFFLPEKQALSDTRGCHEIFGDTANSPSAILKGMLEDEVFWQQYDRVFLSNNQGRVVTYIRRDQIDNVIARGIDVQTLSCWPH